jgi:hypothetical protein
MAKILSTRTLRLLHSVLNRSVRHAQARDKVKRNVVMLCEIPTGRPGRHRRHSPSNRPKLYSPPPTGPPCALTSCSPCSSVLGPRNYEP